MADQLSCHLLRKLQRKSVNAHVKGAGKPVHFTATSA
jgi:hypothetical protein